MKSFFFMILLSQVAFAKTNWESGTKKIPLIELYSSEGCSSCPPAEKWMANQINNPDHFKKFTPINFHVDYWNKLGWIDRFSKSQFTDRQKKYASTWGTGRIYTPAFVVDGVDRGASGSLEFLNESSNLESGNLEIKRKDSKTYEVHFNAKEKNLFEIYFAELASGLETKVKAGENEGRTLVHNFVVLKLIGMDLIDQKAVVNLPEPSVDAPKATAFAVWVTKKGDLTPVQSIGGTFR